MAASQRTRTERVEQKDIIKAWIEEKIEAIKPVMLAKAKRCNWAMQKIEWDSTKVQVEAQRRKEGCGEEEGYNKD